MADLGKQMDWADCIETCEASVRDVEVLVARRPSDSWAKERLTEVKARLAQAKNDAAADCVSIAQEKRMTSTTIPLFPDPARVRDSVPSAELFQRVACALKSVRLQQSGLGEFEIHDALCKALADAGIAYRREYTFGPGCRADIWVQGIAVEVKKQRPAKAALLAQVQRYAEQPSLIGLIVVLERSIHLPKKINGKPVAILSLNALWGIAL